MSRTAEAKRLLGLAAMAFALICTACSSDNQTVPEPSHLDGLSFDADRILAGASNDSLGVNVVGEPTTARPTDLARALGDSARPLLRANIAGEATVTLEQGNADATVTVKQFASIDDAFGYYARIRPAGLIGVPFGTEGYRQGNDVTFTRDAYVASVRPNPAMPPAAIDTIARAIDLAIGGATGLPTTFILFPFSGKIQSSDQFTAYDFLGFPGVERVYSTDYAVAGDTVTLFLTQDPDKNKFAALMEGAEDLGDVATAPPLFNFEPGYAISFEHPDFGSIITGRVRGKIVGLISPGRDAGHQLLSRWVKGLQ